MKGIVQRALAGVAAAALAVCGLAAGASTASAAPTDSATITVNNAQAGHTYTAYKFANLVNAVEDDDTVYVEVQTVETYKDAVSAAALTAYNDGKETTDEDYLREVPELYTGNPAAWVATFSAAQLRLFADALDAYLPVDGATADNAATVAEGAISTQLNVTEGWFAVTDTVDNQVQSGATAIVASTLSGAAGDVTVATGEGQTNINSVGYFNAKSENTPSNPDKTATVNGQTTSTVSVGDDITYTITTTVPAAAAGYEEEYLLTITDTASEGLTVPSQSTGFTVTVDGTATDFTFSQTTDENNNKVTTITINVAGRTSGVEVKVVYTATVNSNAFEEDADTGEVSNSATVTNNSGVTSEPGKTSHKSYGFDFTKVGADDEDGLSGVTFNIYSGENTDADDLLKFDADGMLDMDRGSAELMTGTDGVIAVKGLAAGKYTVVETSTNTNEGYSSQFLAKFVIEISDSGQATVSGTNDYGLASTTTSGDIEVLNVKSISQLPQTGAAGIALFVVLGLLIAGAGVTVWMKSRGVRNAING